MAITAPASRSAPPRVSVRSRSPIRRASGQEPRANSVIRREVTGVLQAASSDCRPDFPAHRHPPYPAAGRHSRSPLSIGRMREFMITGPQAGPYGVTTGSDGALWCTLVHSGQIARVAVGGEATLFDL